MDACRDPYSEHIDAIQNWVEFLEVLDAWDNTTSSWWDADLNPRFQSISGRYGWWATILIKWILDNSNVPTEPLLDITRMIQAKDPLGQWTAFRVTSEEIQRRRDNWSPYRQILIDQAISAEHKTVDSSAQTGEVECYVTLLQMAGIVNRDKRTLERLAVKVKFPPPAVEGGGGKPGEWRWSDVRPILEVEYGRSLPDIFPADRFVR
jgi:hypothetical protein